MFAMSLFGAAKALTGQLVTARALVRPAAAIAGTATAASLAVGIGNRIAGERRSPRPG